MENIDEAEEMNDSLVPMEKTPKEITSLEQMESWLTTLEIGANISAQEALKAQIQVIRFIQSPTLIDTTLDTLILCLKKSLKKAENEDEKEHLRESFSLMIQNYVFFFDARMQYAIKENKDAARQIFLQAGQMLSNSVKNVALMAVSGKRIKEIATVMVHNLFDEDDDASAINLFNRIWIWWNKDKIIAEKKEEFYVTLYNICKKLGKYQPLIGESILINGMIERYTPAICNYSREKALTQGEFNVSKWQKRFNELEKKQQKQQNEIEKKRQKQQNEIEKKRQEELVRIDANIKEYSTKGIRWKRFIFVCLGSLGTFVVSLIIGLIRLIAKEIDDNNVGGWFAEQMYWTLGFIGVVIAVFFLVEIVNIINSRNYAKKLIRNRDNDIAKVNQQYDVKRDELQNQMNELQRQMESQMNDVYAEAQSIAEELKQIAESYNEI